MGQRNALSLRYDSNFDYCIPMHSNRVGFFTYQSLKLGRDIACGEYVECAEGELSSSVKTMRASIFRFRIN